MTLAKGAPAPFAGELVAAYDLAALVAKVHELEKFLDIERAAADAKFGLVDSRRQFEVDYLQNKLTDVQKRYADMLVREQDGPPWWRSWACGVVVGTAGAVAAVWAAGQIPR